MSATSNAAADSAASIEPAIRPEMPWRVVSAGPLTGYKLKVTFVDGLVGEVHMADLQTALKAGVFAPLRNEQFKRVQHWGAVTWPGELDLAPDAIYDDINPRGVCRIGPFAG